MRIMCRIGVVSAGSEWAIAPISLCTRVLIEGLHQDRASVL
jgi:hypothetical protein